LLKRRPIGIGQFQAVLAQQINDAMRLRHLGHCQQSGDDTIAELILTKRIEVRLVYRPTGRDDYYGFGFCVHEHGAIVGMSLLGANIFNSQCKL
jgi:hypothetical protein